MAPVVANITTPLFMVRDVARKARGWSSWRGVVGGAAIGLAIVGGLVVGTRLAWSHGHSAAAGSVSQPMNATPPQTPPPARVQSDFPPPEEAPEAMSPPVIAATALPLAPPPARWSPPVASPRARPTPPAVIAPKTVEVAAAPSVPAAAAASADPGPDESAPSLVPVIPSSAPAEADPLVKAVQHDIEEDQTRGAK